MDYSKIYIELIERSFERSLDCYTEKHHIIPKCMGGDNMSRNIAVLTPEEHYIAHQLLVKIYPDNIKLLYSATMMCANRQYNNKLYGWLRRQLCERQKGKIITQETRQKISKANKGKICSEETRIKLSKAKQGKLHNMFGTPRSLETRKKLSEANKGKKLSLETRQKMSESQKGREISLETRKKLSEANKGKIISSETLLRMSESQKGKKHSEETKRRMTEAQKGRVVSEETRKKLSEANKGKTGRVMSSETIIKREATKRKNRLLVIENNKTITG